MAVGYSYIIAITTILLTFSLSELVHIYLYVLGGFALSIASGSSYLLIRHHKSIPKKLANIRREFIENNEQKDKQ